VGPPFDLDSSSLQSRVFSDPDIYRRELDGIFRRSWLFVAPETWLTQPRAFVTTRMGEDEVFLWRGDDDVLRAFINRCVAGHQTLVRSSRGSADSLICGCHGWRYDNVGWCVDFPIRGLARVPQVEVFKGLVFANHDPDAHPLTASLGDFAWYLDLLLNEVGGIEAYGEDALRWTVETNWKVPAQEFCGDMYRQRMADMELRLLFNDACPTVCEEGFQVFTEGGAMAILTGENAPVRTSVKSLLGPPRESFAPAIGTLFPTLSFDWRYPSFHVWHPLGPSATEINSFCMVARDSSPEAKESARRTFQRQYGPAGLRSQADAARWSSTTAQASRSRNLMLNLQMGAGRERGANVPGRVGDLFSECNQRAFFAWWQRELEIPSQRQTQWLHN
jgi:nitrite reductase/ring-hydroxylating ferredoxin subunit